MNNKRSQRGQALILIVLGIIGLVAITALAIDAGNSFSDRRQAQNAADAAALAAALAKIGDEDWHLAGVNLAISNGYEEDTSTVTVYTMDNPLAVGCDPDNPIPSPVNPNDSTDKAEYYILVTIHSTVNTFFAPIVGIDQLHNCVEAIARAKTGSAGSFGGGNGIMTLATSGTGFSYTGSGAANVTGGISSNAGISSSGSGDFTVGGGVASNGNLSITGSGSWNVANGASINGNFSKTGSSDFVVTSGGFLVGGTYSSVGSGDESPWPPTHLDTPRPAQPDPLDGYLTPPANPGSCISVAYTGSAAHTINPGCYTRISQTGSGNLTLNPGIYYLDGTGFSMTGSGDLVANGVLIYVKTGSVSMTGSGSQDFSPMTSGAYKGLALYMDKTNSSDVRITGSGDSSFSGTVYAPSSDITITGSGGTGVLDSQIVCSRLTMTGSGGINVTYNADHNYQIPSVSTIELVK
jgi:hypothetical protein